MKIASLLTATALLGFSLNIMAAPQPVKHVLATQVAHSASIETHTTQNKKTYRTLTLHGVTASTQVVNTSKSAENDSITTAQFAKKTHDQSNTAAPNATLIDVQDVDNGVTSKVAGTFTLSNPVYNKKDKTLTYKIDQVYQAFNTEFNKAQPHQVTLITEVACGWIVC